MARQSSSPERWGSMMSSTIGSGFTRRIESHTIFGRLRSENREALFAKFRFDSLDDGGLVVYDKNLHMLSTFYRHRHLP